MDEDRLEETIDFEDEEILDVDPFEPRDDELDELSLEEGMGALLGELGDLP